MASTSDLIKRYKESKDLKSKELAKIAGLSAATITRMENGDSLTRKNITKVAHAMGLTYYDLVENSVANEPEGEYASQTNNLKTLKTLLSMSEASIERMERQIEIYEEMITDLRDEAKRLREELRIEQSKKN